jgi:hypothetical protein
LSAGVLSKLSQATDPRSSSLAIWFKGARPYVWGLIDQQNGFFDYISHESESGPERLGPFQAVVTSPGWVTVYHEYERLAELRVNSISVRQPDVLWRGPVYSRSADHERWISGSRKFLFPVKVLSARFRRLFLKALAQAHAAGKLQFFGDLAPLADPPAFARYLAPLQHKKWVVYAKAPFGGPQHVLEYLGRYTHRVAISHRRLLALENGPVSFEWKDYRDAGKSKVMSVPAGEFIRRFLQHVLPPGFQRIRYYGFLANCHRADKLALGRQLLATACSLLLPQPADCRDFLAALTGTNSRLCPQGGRGILIRLQFFPPSHGPVPLRVDSS